MHTLELKALVALLFISSPLSAIEITEYDENVYYFDINKIVTATRIPQSPQESPVAITIIDREMINRSTAVEVIDLFRLVPGMRVAYANGNIYSVAYHGYASAFPNRMQVLIDGRSVFTPLFSIVDWNNIGLNIDDIERIEVIRGSNSASFGANAVLGTINIITRKPFQVAGHTVSLTTGDIGTKKFLYRYADTDDRYEQRLSLYTNRDDGFDNVNDSKSIDSLSYRGIYSPVYNQSIDFQFGFSGGPVGGWGVPGTAGVINLFPEREKDTNAHYEAIRWTRKLSPQSEQEWSISNNYLSWNDVYVVDLSLQPANLSGQSTTLSLYSGNAIRTELEYQQIYTSQSKSRFVWGLGYKLDRLKDLIILNRSSYIGVSSQRLFTHYEKHLSHDTLLNIGLMGERNGLVGFNISPRLSINYNLSSNNNFRISASRAKRTPSLYEYYNDNNARLDSTSAIIDIRYKSDPNIKEETLTSFDLGYIGTYFDNQLTIDVKLYYEYFNNIINNAVDNVSFPDAFGSKTWVWTNTGHTTNKGLEFQASYDSDSGWTVDAQYAYAHFTGELINEIIPLSYKSDEKITGYMPKNSYAILLSSEFNDSWLFSLEQIHTSSMEWLGGGTIDNINRTDIKLSKTLNIKMADTKVSLLIQNLFDAYYEFEGLNNTTHNLNEFDRRIYLKIETNI